MYELAEELSEPRHAEIVSAKKWYTLVPLSVARVFRTRDIRPPSTKLDISKFRCDT